MIGEMNYVISLAIIFNPHNLGFVFIGENVADGLLALHVMNE